MAVVVVAVLVTNIHVIASANLRCIKRTSGLETHLITQEMVMSFWTRVIVGSRGVSCAESWMCFEEPKMELR